MWNSLLQSVSALLEKFQRSEQVFDPNLDPDSDDGNGEGWAPSQLEFQPEFPEDSVAGEGIGEFPENGRGSLGTLGPSKRWGWGGIPSPNEEFQGCSGITNPLGMLSGPIPFPGPRMPRLEQGTSEP